MKKVFFCLLLSILWTSIAYAVTIDGITYTLNTSTSTATVTSTPNGNIIIPSIVVYNNTEYNVTAVSGVGSSLIMIEIPSTVERIEGSAFLNRTSLVQVNLSEGLRYIGDFAFEACESLTSITIPSTVTYVGKGAFRDCMSLTKINWNAKHCADFAYAEDAPFNFKRYGYTTHDEDYRNNYTTSIIFGEEVEYIPSYLCYNFIALVTLVIPNSVKEIGAYAFHGFYHDNSENQKYDNNLTTVTLGTGLERIGSYAFYGRRSLKSIVINNNCTAIGSYAFSQCGSLSKVTLGKRISLIGTYAFSSCNINTINIYCPTPPDILGVVFNNNGIKFNLITLNVPSKAVDAYKAADIWQNMSVLAMDNDVRTFMLTTSSENESKGTTTQGGVYDEDSEVLIYAAAKDGYRFSKWSDGNTENPRIVKMIGNLSYTAQFEVVPPVYTYTITTSANTVEGRTIGGGVYESGTQVTLAAIGNAGYHFVQWADGNTANPRQITVNSNSSYVAQFAKDVAKYTLTTSSTNSSQGTAFGQGIYEDGTSVAIYAAAKDGYRFSKWSDGNTENPRIVKMIGNLSYTAQFEVIPPVYTYTITTSANAVEGTTIGGGVYESGTQVTLAAIGNAGYHFVQWADGNTTNPRQINVTSNGSYIAQFAKDVVKYTLTTSSTNSSQGTAFGQGKYEEGTNVTIFAVANDGYHFTQWHDGNVENPRMVTVSCDAMYFANFVQNPTLYELKVEPENSLQGWTTEGGVFEFGKQVMIYAHPASGYVFKKWNDGSKENPRFLKITESVGYSAMFEDESVVSINSIRGANLTPSARKIVRNGQTFIEYEDKIFTMQGIEVK